MPAAGLQCTAAVDIYSLGIVIWVSHAAGQPHQRISTVMLLIFGQGPDVLRLLERLSKAQFRLPGAAEAHAMRVMQELCTGERPRRARNRTVKVGCT